ncbi:BTAD domain-containing putative transcriptional regulator [Phytohabitans rumicis]|uniref:OmpR/PhoB-type domain-containing protein n=1 Tax=Phytohabitans rumicis TaxID=1076125 RepID=A0A6V8LFG1_9ACTN|nr:BTAD domain-containing putative transcriptional regulator [Phytohabitans rumicis]GFJ96002.1 hypothetical protein Prum_096440 [Phytohabitans rumicis]
MRAGLDDELRLNVLGPVTATRAGHPLELGGRRQRAVLAVLVTARGDAVSSDRLIDCLWGDEPPPRPLAALQSYVSHLRRVLEPGRAARSRGSVIVSQGTGYALRIAPDTVDASQFEDLLRAAGAADAVEAVAVLTRALALWRGPAFADYAGEPWAAAEIARLHELREVAREQLVAARLCCGEAAVVVPEIEALVGEQPLREERWRLLVLALYRAHRQGDALAALSRARRTLADELGVDPGPALRALEEEVRAQSLPVPAPPGSGSPGYAVAEPPVVDDLVEREREVAELRGCLAGALEGRARLMLVEGPAGIGKTRLLGEARRLAAGLGFETLAARGGHLEREYGFGAVRQLFEPAVAEPERGARLLTGAARAAEAVFDVAAAPDGSLAVLHGLYWLTVRLSGDGPLLLTVDDLQWCDTASLRYLAYLAHRMEGLPVVIVAALRTGGPYDDEALLAELAHSPETTSVRPGPLTVDGTGDLVRRRLAGAHGAFVNACYRATSGNPLLLRQLLRAVQAQGVRPDAAHAGTVTAIGSRAVSSLVLTRLAQLLPDATAVARAVAVLGNGAALPAVAALAELPEDAAAAAVAALARAEVLRDDYPLGFVHPLVADAVYRDLPPGERQMHHDRAARALDAVGASAEQVGAQLLHVPHRGDPWVVRVLGRAAARAGDRGAADAAATYLTRALAEPPAPDRRPLVLLELGRVQASRDGQAALRHLREAYETLPDRAARIRAALMLARTLVFAGPVGEASTFARGATAELFGEPGDGRDDDKQGLLALARIGGYLHDVDQRRWRGPAPAVHGDGPGARMLAADLAWEAVMDSADRERAVALARFAIADGVLLDADNGLLWAAAGTALNLAEEDTFAFWEAAQAHAHRKGSLFAALAAHLWRGHAEWLRGDLREAYQSLVTSYEQSASGAPPSPTRSSRR